jgi:hypothetical protein
MSLPCAGDGAGICDFIVVGHGSVEDAALKKRFGAIWDTYRQSVLYKFILKVV